MNNLLFYAVAGVTLFNLAVLFLVLDNMKVIPSLGSYRVRSALPEASILVPARNEVSRIAACLDSLIAQDYPVFEILVFDDQSTDRTADILAVYAKQNPNIKLLPCQPLPEGWLGKNWACHQLAQAASGEVLLFTDADTLHHPDSLKDGVALLQAKSLGMLSAIPKELVISWAERLTIPLLVFILAGLLPQRYVWRLRASQISGAIGQYLLFWRETYEQIGGHEAIRDQVADDFVLARRVKTAGLPGSLADGSSRVQCRMYQNRQDIVLGLGKNLFAVFDHRLLVFGFAWIWLVATAWTPWLVILTSLAGAALSPAIWTTSLVAGISAVLSWWIILRRFDLPQYLAAFYPLIFFAGAILAALSVFQYWSGGAKWKGRQLPRRVSP